MHCILKIELYGMRRWELGFGAGLIGSESPGKDVTKDDKFLIATYCGYNLEGW